MAKAQLFFQPILQFFDNNGKVLSGGTLTFYEAGTSTLKDTYADSSKSTANPNPIMLDSAGRPDNGGSAIQIWLDGSYKVVLKDSSGNTIRTEDNVNSLAQLLTVTTKTADYTVTESDRDKIFSLDASGGSFTITLLAGATAGSGFQVMFIKTDSSSNTITIDANASETINGALTYTLYNQFDAITIFWNGSNWGILSKAMGKLNSSSTGYTLASGTMSISTEDSRTNSAARPLTIAATTSATPGAGIATGMLFRAESEDENPANVGALDFALTDVTAGAEDSSMDVYLRVAGGSVGRRYRWQATSTGQVTFTHGVTGTRTITWPDEDLNLTSTAFRAYKSDAQVISSSTITTVQFDAESFDKGDTFDSTTNYRHTPTVADTYLYTATVTFAATSSTAASVIIYLYKNGSVASQATYTKTSANHELSVTISDILDMNGSTDYVEVRVFQNLGSTYSLATGANKTFFSGTRVI